jgi:hypothetical protein
MDRRLEQSPDLRVIPGDGQRALQGVILFPEAGGELRVIAGEDFQASWVHGLQRRLPFDDVQ